MDVGVVSEVCLFGCVHFLCELSCSRDKVALSVGLTSGADLAPCPLRSRWRAHRSVGIAAISQCRAGGDARALGSSNPEGYAHLPSSGDRVRPLLRSSAVRGGYPAENGTRGPPPPPRQLSSPPFGLVLLSSGAFTIQCWVEGSPPRVRRHAAALWPRFVAAHAGRGRLPSSASVSCLSHPVIEPLCSWSA
ncbi:hypothetical protein NDU88_002997 [Pleurodeles waltl]|uniref:Uncharacterized protein n=1 Tax=Pleurodeles waltl TaxID=8319 RepID=A0AAV7MQI5_PLEWA|nr:hypothetical protein NDU88_002997 [Pleurodeles waltl]